MGALMTRPACSPSPTPGSPTTPALTGSTGARPPAPPGAPPRSTPLVSTSTTRATTGSVPLTLHAPPPCRPRPGSGGPGQELSTLAAPHHPSRGQTNILGFQRGIQTHNKTCIV